MHGTANYRVQWVLGNAKSMNIQFDKTEPICSFFLNYVFYIFFRKTHSSGYVTYPVSMDNQFHIPNTYIHWSFKWRKVEIVDSYDLDSRDLSKKKMQECSFLLEGIVSPQKCFVFKPSRHIKDNGVTEKNGNLQNSV